MGTEPKGFERTIDQSQNSTKFIENNMKNSVLKKLHKPLISMLQNAQTFEGSVFFAINIGRVLLENLHKDFMLEPLTSSGDGIDFVSNLKVAKTTRMFEPAPYDWGISYEFMCIDLRSEIDISLKDPDDPLFRSIAENLYIPYVTFNMSHRSESQITKQLDFRPNLSSLEILTKSVDKNLDIRSVRLKRHLRYLSTQEPNIVLNIIENQDLALGMNNDGWTRAIALPTEDMKQDNRIWFTASITSIVAEEKLKGNCNLELGEAATWNPNEFLDERIVESMYNVAKEVVKRIDSVGLDQRIDSASIGLRESMSSRPGSANGDPATGEFW
ncbi:MAG: hypothetical protein M1829_001510 [Trizodia sp. TS-e1964]|nr:MAG: hypothetical protein M1829_001510 [Trizodia sp. TS-e1964]